MSESRLPRHLKAVESEISRYRESHDPELVRPLLGVIVRYFVPPEADVSDDTPLEEVFEHASADSLTMMEIVLDIQEVFEITIEDSDLPHLKSVDDLVDLIVSKK